MVVERELRIIEEQKAELMRHVEEAAAARREAEAARE